MSCWMDSSVGEQMNTRYFEISERGHNVRCKLYYHDLSNILRSVVFCHGFGGHKDNGAAEKFAQRMLSAYADIAMVTFNWPSHGDDEKERICLSDCDGYLESVLDYVQGTLGVESVYGYATSFGGYLLLKYIAEHGNPFRKVGMRCPAVNMYDVLTTAIMSSDERDKVTNGEEVPVGFDRKIMVSPSFLEELRSCDVQTMDFRSVAEDLLILHGTADEIVPFEAGKSFAEGNGIAFRPVEDADHRFQDPAKMEAAIESILEFFAL